MEAQLLGKRPHTYLEKKRPYCSQFKEKTTVRLEAEGGKVSQVTVYASHVYACVCMSVCARAKNDPLRAG